MIFADANYWSRKISVKSELKEKINITSKCSIQGNKIWAHAFHEYYKQYYPSYEYLVEN